MFNPDKYRSVEWQKGGRAYPALDCFGIVNEIRRDLGLAPWPDFAGVTKDDNGLDREARGLMTGLSRCAAECNPRTNVTFLPLSRFARRFVRVEYYQ